MMVTHWLLTVLKRFENLITIEGVFPGEFLCDNNRQLSLMNRQKVFRKMHYRTHNDLRSNELLEFVNIPVNVCNIMESNGGYQLRRKTRLLYLPYFPQ
jgi:hypothetical protein